MKRNITLTLLTFWVFSMSGQTYSTGTMTLNATNGNNLNYSAKIDVTDPLVTLTLVGSSTTWMGIGFNNSSMANSGDVVIFDGTDMTDRHFVGFAIEPEMDTQQDWTVVSNNIVGGVRTVVGTRARTTTDTQDYNFSASAQALTLVYARGQSLTIQYHGGNSCGTTVANLILGTNDFSVSDFTIYPNPAKGFTSLKLPAGIESGEIKIYDVAGKMVKSQILDAVETNISTSELKTGTYLLVVRTEYGNATKTLLVE